MMRSLSVRREQASGTDPGVLATQIGALTGRASPRSSITMVAQRPGSC